MVEECLTLILKDAFDNKGHKIKEILIYLIGSDLA